MSEKIDIKRIENGVKRRKTELVPPDGGWGWVVVAAYALGNVIIIPIIQNFGLLYKDRLKYLNMSGTDIATIININSSFGMLMGLVNGSLLKKYGYRKISIAGGLFVSTGVIITAFMDTFIGFIISYGLITSMGFGMALSSYSLAVNTYFRNRRGMAMGIATTGMGLGPVFMPLVISYLLGEFGVSGAMLIIGGLALNSLVTSSLLQPVKWHMKEVEVKEEEMQIIGEKEEDRERKNSETSQNLRKNSVINASNFSLNFDGENVTVYDSDTPIPKKKHSIVSLHRDDDKKLLSNTIEEENGEDKYSQINKKKNDTETQITVNETKDIKDKGEETVWQKILSFMDADLLKDPKYINLMLGMGIAICAEMNFSLLTPFILSDFGYSTQETAQVLSCLAFTDIIFRFIAPFVLHYLKKSVKLMYCFSLVLLIISRTALTFTTTYGELMAVALALGISKGFRTVYMTLLVPSYVPIEKLANASGLQMMSNGVIILACGPVFGLIRDLTGSYIGSIYVINLITFITIAMWTIEALYYKYCKR